MMIERPKYVERLKALMNNGRVKIITGVRRCGKTYILTELFRRELLSRGVKENHFIVLSFDGTENSSLRNPLALEEYVRGLIKDEGDYYLILDEVQNSLRIVNPLLTDGKIVLAKDDDPNAISYVHAVISLMKIKNLDIYITGSNSRFLSKDILTEFRDRGDEIHVLPLSFSEYASKKDGEKETLYEEYALYGGMPLILSRNSDEERETYLKNLYALTYEKDVVERNKIADPSNLNILTEILASSIGSLVNPHKIVDTFKSVSKISILPATIYDYLDFLEEAFLLKKVNRYDIRGRKKIGALYKYYFSDVGIRNSRLDFLSFDHGHVMENIIYNELLYRGYSVQIGVINSYKKVNGKTTREEYETDFVCKKGSRTYYIQSSYELGDKESYLRESRPFALIGDSFKKIIVTRRGGPIRHDEKGVTTIGIVDFLLKEDSLDL